MIYIDFDFNAEDGNLGLLGRLGETGTRALRVDCTEVLTEYPGATIKLVYRRAPEEAPYELAVTMDGSKAVAALSDTELAIPGRATVEARAYASSGELVRKSRLFTGTVASALCADGQAPDSPYKDALNTMAEATGAANTAAQEATTAAQSAQGVADTVQAALDSGAFVGPQGAQGPAGPQGEPGAAGATGPQGEPGLDAPQIDDTQASTTNPWSGAKVQAALDTKEDAQGAMALIEKIIVGYSVTTSQPSDWATNWTAYYINTGTARVPVYTAVSGDTAPVWTDGTYYAYSSGGVSSISRSVEPNVGSYNFDALSIFADVMAGSTAQIRIAINSKMYNNFYNGIQTSSCQWSYEISPHYGYYMPFAYAPYSGYGTMYNQLLNIPRQQYISQFNANNPIVTVVIDVVTSGAVIPSGSTITISAVRRV